MNLISTTTLSLTLLLASFTAGGSDDLRQRRFEHGVDLMFSGNYEAASAVFSSLYDETKSSRVKLEWARSAFLLQDYDISEQLFNEVMETSPPQSVQDSIQVYLDNMNQTPFDYDLSLSFLYDSNPFTLPAPQKILVLGTPFNYTPPQEQKTLQGIKLDITTTTQLVRKNSINVRADITSSQYKGQNNNKLLSTLAINTHPYALPNVFIEGGVSNLFEQGALIFETKYVELGHSHFIRAGVFQSNALKLNYSEQRYPSYPGLNGKLINITYTGSTKITPTLSLDVGVGAADLNVANKFLSYRSEILNFGLTSPLEPYASDMKLAGSITHTNYRAMDNMFLVTRHDRQYMASIAVQPQWKLFTFHFPSIQLGRIINHSTIPIQSYNRSFINFTFL